MTTSLRGDLQGKVALITGGSKGIGLGIAHAFVASGAKVMLVARKSEQLEAAVAELGGPEVASCMSAHVGKPEDAEAAVAETIEMFGRIDILVNNAATNPYVGYLIDIDMARFDKTFEVNLRGPLIWTQQAWRQWMNEHGGAVINIASGGGFATSTSLSVYNLTKAATIHMTKQLAAELGPKVRVNCIAPGLIRTDFARFLWDDGKGDKVAEGYPLKRLGEPDDIGEAALYFAAGAGWCTGQTIVIDGGGLIDFMENRRGRS